MVVKVPKEFTPGFSTTKKPVVPVEVDKSNPLAKGLWDWHLANNNKEFELQGVSYVGTLGGSEGYRAKYANGVDTKMRYVSSESEYSVFVVWAQNDFSAFTATGFTLYSERPNSTQIFKIALDNTDYFSFVTRNDASGGLINTPTGPNIDQDRIIHTGCFVKRGDSNRDLYCDDATKVNITTTSGGTYSTSVQPSIGYDPQDSAASAEAQNIFAVYTWNRALTDQEVKQLERNPYQIFKPVVPVIFFPESVVAAGSVTVNLTGQSSTAAQGTPSISAGCTVNVAGQVESTTEQGSVTVSTGGAVSVAVNGQESTSQQGSISVSSGGAVSINLVGQAANSSQGSPSVTGDSLATITGQSSTAQQGTVTVDISATPTVVNITGQAANCSQGALGITAAVNMAVSGQAANCGQGLVSIAGSSAWTVQNNTSTTWVIQV